MIRHLSLPCRSIVTLVAIGAFDVAIRAAEPVEATRVRILLVTHTNGEVAGRECGFALDGQTMQKALETNLKKQGLENRYTLDVLTGDDVTADKVLAYYRQLKTKPTESLFFFYAGHGVLNSNHEHVMTMNGRSLRRTELLMKMARHDARLTVVLTSSCANLSGETAKNDPEKAQARPTSTTAPATIRAGDGLPLRQLLFRGEGVVDVNAARAEEYGWGHPELGGTFFTVAVSQLFSGETSRLDRNQDGLVEWHEFYGALRGHTARLAGYHGNVQNTMAYSLPSPARSTSQVRDAAATTSTSTASAK